MNGQTLQEIRRLVQVGASDREIMEAVGIGAEELAKLAGRLAGSGSAEVEDQGEAAGRRIEGRRCKNAACDCAGR